MPLVWAHAEYVKLARSLGEDRIFDMPPQPVERYQKQDTRSEYAIWRFNQKIRRMPQGKHLRIETLAPAVVHWSTDGWKTSQDDSTHDTGLGVHNLDLDVSDLPASSVILFTLFWNESQKWEGLDYQLEIEA